jgi:hypothetical protein
MGQFVFNISKGRAIEFYNRVKVNDPANAALIIVPINAGATTDDVMRGYDTLSDLLGDANVAEVTSTVSSGTIRKTLVDADLAALTTGLDDANDRFRVELPDQTWAGVAQNGATPNWTDLVVCYDSDTTAGTDANIVPITNHDFAITPDGSDVLADFLAVASGGFFEASGGIT